MCLGGLNAKTVNEESPAGADSVNSEQRSSKDNDLVCAGRVVALPSPSQQRRVSIAACDS